jgi:hypothetical protein
MATDRATAEPGRVRGPRGHMGHLEAAGEAQRMASFQEWMQSNTEMFLVHAPECLVKWLNSQETEEHIHPPPTIV